MYTSHNCIFSAGCLSLLFCFVLVPGVAAQSVQFGQGPAIVSSDGGVSSGVAWGDYDSDGDLDLFITNAQGGDNFLYRNEGDGTFTKIVEGILVTDGGRSSGASWGDYDNDGDADLLVASQGGDDNWLYRNDGEGSFVRVEKSAGIVDGGESYAPIWVDYDNDGWLDIFFANGGFGEAEVNFLYRNKGDGTFERITDGPVVTDSSNSFSASWADIDNDGDQDLFVANGLGQDNSLYVNNGDGSFTRVMEGAIVTDGGYSSGGSWADYDNDGDLDLVVTNGCCAIAGHANFFYRNDGDGQFTKMSRAAMVLDGAGIFGSYSASWADVDNDGDLDLFVANWAEHNRLYLNDGEGGFTKVITGALVMMGGDSGANAWADFDEDGDPDLVVANWSQQNNYFYLNQRKGRSWLGVRLVGTASNSSGIGARIKVRAIIYGRSVEQVREISSLTGWRSQDGYPHFGLGDAKMVESIVVEWPSGKKDELSGVDVNRSITIVEGKGIVSEGTPQE